MRLTVIGCSGSYPGPDTTASCYLVEAPHPARSDRPYRLVVDLGSGALGALQRHVDPLSVDAVLVSHLHADHFFDIAGYYVLRKYHPAGPPAPIPVWGPRALKSRITMAYGLALEPGMNDEFDFRHVRVGTMELGPFRITARRVDHPIEAYGFRIEHDGRALAYSGDTARCQPLVELAAGADLLLAEAAFRDGADNVAHVHMTGSDAATVARDAGVGRLVLTHIPPWHDKQDAVMEAKDVYDGPITLAREGATYDL